MSGWTRDPIFESTLTGAAEIVATNLGAWRDLRITFGGLQHNSGTPDFLLQLGVGGVYDTTHYVTTGATGTNGFILTTSAPTATSIGGIVTILHFNLARSTWADINSGREAGSNGRRVNAARCTEATAWDCLKLLNSTGTNFTANGGFHIYGRQG